MLQEHDADSKANTQICTEQYASAAACFHGVTHGSDVKCAFKAKMVERCAFSKLITALNMWAVNLNQDDCLTDILASSMDTARLANAMKKEG